MAELMAPAGDLQKLEYAVKYGADSVYLGGKDFGMRARAGNFSDEDIKQGLKIAHDSGVKVYVTLNIAARNADIDPMLKYAEQLSGYGIDGFIAADPGFILKLKESLPDTFVILSTQANTTNGVSLDFWKKNGVDRVVLARELAFEEIREIAKNRPEGMQLEVFVHGSMCISYSGRCLLSNYLAGRDSNRGDCAQPCRWEYVLSEKSRPGEFFGIEEDSRGSFIFNSRDLCLIDHIPELTAAGIDSFKIEGRMKSIFYAATVTNAYKTAMLRAEHDPVYSCSDLYEELCKVSHRQYTKAFYFGNAGPDSQNYGSSSYIRSYDFIAEVTSDTDDGMLTEVTQKNKFRRGDVCELLSPGKPYEEFRAEEIYDENMQPAEEAPHPNQKLFIKTGIRMSKYSLIRRKASENPSSGSETL